MKSAREHALEWKKIVDDSKNPYILSLNEFAPHKYLQEIIHQAMAEAYEAGQRVGYEEAAQMILLERDCGEYGCKPVANAKAIRELPIKPYGDNNG